MAFASPLDNIAATATATETESLELATKKSI